MFAVGLAIYAGFRSATFSWSEVSRQDLISIGIGLMPLAHGARQMRLRMPRYMAVEDDGLLSPVGMNSELLRESELGLGAPTLDQWADALSSLIADWTAAERLGSAGRQIATAHYSVTVLAPHLTKLLRRLAG